MLGMVNSLKHIPTNTLSLVPLPHTPHISHPHLTPFSFLISQVCTSRRKQQASVRYDSHLTTSLDLRGSILLKGLALAQRAAYLATACVVMHATMQVVPSPLLSHINKYVLGI